MLGKAGSRHGFSVAVILVMTARAAGRAPPGLAPGWRPLTMAGDLVAAQRALDLGDLRTARTMLAILFL